METETETLRRWYLEIIGYDPFAEGMTLEEVRKIREEYETAKAA